MEATFPCPSQNLIPTACERLFYLFIFPSHISLIKRYNAEPELGMNACISDVLCCHQSVCFFQAQIVHG